MNNLAMLKMSKSVGLFFLLLGIALLNNISIPHGNAALKSNIVAFARQLSTLSEIVNHYCPKTELKESNNKNVADQENFSEIYSKLSKLEKIKRCVYITFLLKKDITTKYGFPEEDKEKLWQECKEGIKKEFKEVNDYYKRICKDYENISVMPGFLFNIKLEKYIKLWKKVAYRNEKKWSDTFAMKISKYNALTSKS
ncbi:RAD protein [Plasmodium cynomolgi strain B]|uniref:RAD protein n=1 Tax=Plasmodium cynomolgi (strain B) TaxID=1120755 RepID=K6UF60_PLACD|nr:RAD protein [Plasmodium cynomolgi strain B]GAB69536.1 RAD protein [Plasmodium cynomolgi strain B]